MKKCLALLPGLFFILKTIAQPATCAMPASMTPTCTEACIICDLDGFMGTNNSPTSGSAPSDFCTFVQHNIQWIGFIATSPSLTLTIDVSNCTGGAGLEVAIYESLDCTNFTMVSNCVGGTGFNPIQNGTSGSISTTVPLTVGQYYYFVMDGHGGAVCDYTINVTEGSTAVPPLSPIPAIYGDLNTCPGASLNLWIDPVFGGPQVVWTVDGIPMATGENVDIPFPVPGNFEVCVEASNVCSPAVSLCTNVTVTPLPTTEEEAIICLGDCFIAGDGTSLCAPGTFPIILNSFEGCDSIVEYTIEVIEIPPTILFETICEGESVTVGTEEFSVTGAHSVTLENFQGCDSTVVLNLVVEPLPETIFNEEICAGEVYILGIEVYSESGTYEQIHPSWLDCDSTVTLHLTVSPNDSVYLTESICDGENFEVGTETFGATGEYEVTLENAAGCDSTVFLDLTVNALPVTDLTEEICPGESFFVGPEEFTLSGNYEVVLTSFAGCDSTVNLDLDVVPALTEELNEQICNGQTFTVGTESFGATGEYEVTLTAANGCDSIVTLHLEVVPFLETFLTENICESETFQVGTETFDQTGEYDIDLTSFAGCDSVVHLDLTVFPEPEIFLSENICAGETVTVGAEVFDQTGEYEVVLPSANGCDSTVHLDLTVNLNPSTFLAEEICEGESYLVGSQAFSTTGIHEVVLPSANGCDSTVMLDLHVLPDLETPLTEEICTGQTFSVGTEIFDETGIYEVPLTASTGCDSLVTLDLTVTAQLVELLTESVCYGGTFTAGGQVFDETGFHEIPLVTPDGCDSLVQLDLTVEAAIVTPLSPTLCAGENFTVGTQVFDQTGEYEVTLTAVGGCDSTVMLDLTILDEIETDLDIQICQGQTYSVGTQTFDQTGEYQVAMSASGGCDSTIFLDLEVTDFLTTFLTENICEGEAFQVGSELFDATGNYEVDFVTTGGCDSIVYLDLTVFPNPVTNLVEVICEGETFPVGSQVFDQTGQYEIPLFAFSGCDSTVMLDLTVLPILTENIAAQICDGDVYMVGNQQFTQAGIFDVTLTGSNGCDSLVTLNLAVFDCSVVLSSAVDSVKCAGGNDGLFTFTITNGNGPFNYTWVGQSAPFPAGAGMVPNLGIPETVANLPAMDFTLTVTSADGEMATLTVSIFEPSALSGAISASQFGDFNLPCFGDEEGTLSATVNGGTPPYFFEWENGNTNANLTGLGAGNYPLTVTDAHGCPLELAAEITPPPLLEWSLDIRLPDCLEPRGEIQVADVQGGAGPFLFSLSGSVFSVQNSFEDLPPGGFPLVAQDANGCERDTFISLPPPPEVILSLGDDLTIGLGEEVQLYPVVFPTEVAYVWTGAPLSCDDCDRPLATPLETTVYRLTVSTLDGCTASDELTVFVDKNYPIYIPNAFSPNGDGINDVLTIFAGSEVEHIRSFHVFSRWGESVFEHFDFPPNDIEFGWDGSHRGEEMKPAVFVWFAEVEFVDGEVRLFEGEVVLVR